MNPRASSPAGQDHKGRVRDDHVAQWLWSRFAADPASVRMTASESAWAVEHLRTCEACRAEIGVLANLASASPPELPRSLLAVLAHASSGSARDTQIGDIPDEEDLAMYLALLEVSGEEVARQQFADIWTHIELCPICQAEVESIRGVLVDEHHNAPELQGLWEHSSAWEWRLRVPYRVWVRPRSLRITSEVMDPQIEPPKGISDPLSGERFTIALRDDTTFAPEEWVSVQVEMAALFAQRIAGHIRATRTSSDATTVPADGVPWRLESVPASEEETSAHSDTSTTSGTTNSDGAAKFSILSVGDYQLVLTVAGYDWIVPLTICADISHGG